MQIINKLLLISIIISSFALGALGVWLRLSSLEAFPEVTGDEAWYGVQAQHILEGGPFETTTFSGSPLNPFYTGMHLPLLMLFRPAPWMVRAPAAFCGILAVMFAYVVGARGLDRPTGLTASALLASLPIAVLFSRQGIDASQIPLCGLLAYFFALRAHALGLFLALVIGLIVHPTDIFLLPCVLPVFLARAFHQKTAGSPVRAWRLLLTTLMATAAGLLAMALTTLQRPYVRGYYATLYRSGDWLQFLASYARFLLALVPPVPEDFARGPGFRLWGLGLLLIWVAGTWRLAAQRQWDRLALVAGLVFGLAGFHLMAGSSVLVGAAYRYGVVLIVPSVLAFATLVRSLLVAPTSPARCLARRLQFGGVILACGAMLLCLNIHWFDYYNTTFLGGRESVWTFRTETKDTNRRALRLILRDRGRPASPRTGAARPTVLIAQDWWTYRPLQYYAAPWKDIQVINFETMNPDRRPMFLHDSLVAGAYVVGPAEGGLEQAVRSCPLADRLEHWDFRFHNGNRFLAIYRLRREEEKFTAENVKNTEEKTERR
jgi:hypothetical protein